MAAVVFLAGVWADAGRNQWNAPAGASRRTAWQGDRDVAHMAARRLVQELVVVIDEVAVHRRLVVGSHAPRTVALQAIDVQGASFAKLCRERRIR